MCIRAPRLVLDQGLGVRVEDFKPNIVVCYGSHLAFVSLWVAEPLCALYHGDDPKSGMKLAFSRPVYLSGTAAGAKRLLTEVTGNDLVIMVVFTAKDELSLSCLRIANQQPPGRSVRQGQLTGSGNALRNRIFFPDRGPNRDLGMMARSAAHRT